MKYNAGRWWQSLNPSTREAETVSLGKSGFPLRFFALLIKEFKDKFKWKLRTIFFELRNKKHPRVSKQQASQKRKMERRKRRAWRELARQGS